MLFACLKVAFLLAHWPVCPLFSSLFHTYCMWCLLNISLYYHLETDSHAPFNLFTAYSFITTSLLIIFMPFYPFIAEQLNMAAPLSYLYVTFSCRWPVITTRSPRHTTLPPWWGATVTAAAVPSIRRRHIRGVPAPLILPRRFTRETAEIRASMTRVS